MPPQPPQTRNSRITRVTVFPVIGDAVQIDGPNVIAFQASPTMVVVEKLPTGGQRTWAGLPFIAEDEPSNILVPQLQVTS
ncbi:MAG: hypothetical protein JO086_00110 [Acidimicrobiia bacterium]|nr:hypothetical protein [Acidimicrobiia bacterium]